MPDQDSISVRCYGAIRGTGPGYVELDGDHLSIVVGSADLHLMCSVADWKLIAAAVDRLLNGPLTHRISFDDVGVAVPVTTPVTA